MKKTSGSTAKYFAQVGAMVTGEYTGTRTDGTGYAVAEQETVFLNGLPMVALTPGGNVFVNPGPQGEPYAVITESGQNVWQWKHAPFGDTPPVGSMEYNLRFPGQYADKETGLSYNNNRFLDPRIGGYASPDPIGLNGGMNPYDYVNGDPGNAIDPWGLDFVYLNDSKGAFWQGHSAFMVGGDQNGWTYFSKDSLTTNTMKNFNTLNDFFRSDTASRYDRSYYVHTSYVQYVYTYDYARNHYQDRYNLVTNNCGDLVKNSFENGGVNIPGGNLLPTRPNRQYDGSFGLPGSMSIPTQPVLYPHTPVP